jgi:uncharacterized protein (DUF305 family)
MTMKRLIVTTIALLVMTGTTFAQQPMPMPHKDMPGKNMGPGMDMGMDKKMVVPNATDSPSTSGYEGAMAKMMMDMPKFTGDPDIDFMLQMRPHHQAAIDMAKVVLTNGKDADTKKLAQDIIAAQEKEIAVIDAWLKKKGS